jgi:membrane protein
MSTAIEWGKAFFRKFNADDAMGAGAELGFRFMFALFPLLLFLAALSSYIAQWIGIDNPTEEIIRQAGGRLPADAQSLLEPQLRSLFGSQNPGLITVTAVTAIWAASSGTKTVMKVLNRVYEVEETRPFLRKQATGVGLTLVGGLAFFLSALALVVGQAAGEEIADAIGLGEVWGFLMTWGQIPIVLALLMVAVSLVYWSAPNARVPFRLISRGGVIFVLTWLVATIGFGFYVSNFGSYNATYGSLGAVIILMTWLYLSSLLLIVGAEINVLAAQRVMNEDEREEARLAESQSRAIDAAVQPSATAQSTGD